MVSEYSAICARSTAMRVDKDPGTQTQENLENAVTPLGIHDKKIPFWAGTQKSKALIVNYFTVFSKDSLLD